MLASSNVRREGACAPAGRLNWQLHFGETPKWSSNVKFILVDVEPSQRDADKAALVLRGDAAAIAQQLSSALRGLDTGCSVHWRQQLSQKVSRMLLSTLRVVCRRPLGVRVRHEACGRSEVCLQQDMLGASAAVHCHNAAL